jgi:hypothetical protein
MVMKQFLLACAALSAFVGCCSDGCCKSCGGSTAGHAQTMGQVPASPSTPAVAGRMMQGPQGTAQQVGGAQQMAPQNQGMIMPNAMSAKPTGESMTR